MESDEDQPDPAQMRLVKELHREMADRRIVVNCKNKKKKKETFRQVLGAACKTGAGS